MELPWVLMGLRNHPNTDTGVSPNQLVFGSNIRAPGHPPRAFSSVQPTSFAEKLQASIASQRKPETPWHAAESQRKSHVPKALVSCDEILLREERSLPSLRPKYSGPFKVISRNKKTLTIELYNGHQETVSID
ncbi:Hypothetical predicted protein, partial [Paramuricea clavata]